MLKIIHSLPLIMLQCLSITIAIELLMALLLKVRKKEDILNIILVNILTNPLLVSVSFAINVFYGLSARNSALIIMELAVCLIEGYIYKKYLKYNLINPYLLSVILNASSYFIGSIINNILW